MGIAAIALENTPAFPTFPNRMSTAEISAGLTLPYAAQTIAGTGGAGAVLVLMFMSCTSAISSQLIGVSTVISYDVYKTCALHPFTSFLVQTLIKNSQT
jgi:Na+/proline symporter